MTTTKTKNVTPELVGTEVAVPKTAALAIPPEFTGLEEVGSLKDTQTVYFRLLQEADAEIKGSHEGLLVDTLMNTLYDIRQGDGTPVSVIPLTVIKEFEVYRPRIDSQGRIHNKDFGDKIQVLKEWDDLVQLALKQNDRSGTRRSYVVSKLVKDKNGVDVPMPDVLVQQCNKVYVLFENDIICLSLRGSKIQKFFTKWNRLMQRKRNPDGSQIPAYKFQYLLSSVKEHNPLSNTNYWNFDIADGEPITDAQRIELDKQVAIIVQSRNNNTLSTVGDDVD